MKISIVTTMYYSEPYIREFYQRCVQQVLQITDDYEIIFVNDGSPDDFLDVALSIYKQDENVKTIEVSRNFGYHKAIMCGLDQAVGDYIFPIDVDLEEETEWFVPFYNQMKNDRRDIVYGVQQKRKGNWFERWTGALAYSVFNALCNVKIENNITAARLMTKRYVKALCLFEEREPVFSEVCALAGFKQSTQTVNKKFKGKTTYTIKKKVAIFVNMITAFSSTPLNAIFYTGVFIFFGAAVYAFYLLTNRVFFARPLDGWTSVMMSIWLLDGLIILFIGVVGIYLSRVFIEIKQQPTTIIKEFYERE